MFNVFKPQTFFLHFTFWQKHSAFIKLVNGTPSLPKVFDFFFPEVQLLPHFLCWKPFARMSLRSGRSKMTQKKQNGSRLWIAATTRIRTSSFHPCGGRDATHGIWAGRLCLSPFSSALKSLVIVHIKCHCDWPALWNHRMRFPLKIKHPPCIDEKRGLLPRRLASLVLWWSDRLLWPIAYNLPSIRRNFLLIAVVQPSSRHRRHLTSSCQNPNRPTTDTWLRPVKSLPLSMILLFTINLISCTLRSFVLLIWSSRLMGALFLSASVCQDRGCIRKTGNKAAQPFFLSGHSCYCSQNPMQPKERFSNRPQYKNKRLLSSW